MHTKYLINIATVCDNPKTKLWSISKTGDQQGVIHQWCYAKDIVFKAVSETVKIEDCFYIQTNGKPKTELTKDETYDRVFFVEDECF